MKIFLLIIAIIFSIFLILVDIKTLKDLKVINEISEEKILLIFTLYENIFTRLILPKSFLYMKNRGSNLCEHDDIIPYIDYEITDFFM